MSPDADSRRRALAAFLLYLGFVVYGSLVPFEHRALAWDQAVSQFHQIAYLELGIVSRADWVANIVLYVPLAFFGCLALCGMGPVALWAPLGVAVVGALSLATAVALEFSQQWFAPRTVSANDLIAESAGILIGILLWIFGRRHAGRLWDDFARGGRPSVQAAWAAYALVYGALSLFPYDFVLSGEELRWKLVSGQQGWLVAGDCGDAFRCAARLALDAVAVTPFGVLGALLWPRVSLDRWFAAGVLLGLVLEGVQLLLASGISQGLSVPLRGAGMALGALAGTWLRQAGPRPVARMLVTAAPLLVLPYLAGLALVAGWFSTAPRSLHAALARLPEVRWLPLYYHYFTTEPEAMASTLAQFALYAPVGLLAWALGARGAGRQGTGGPWIAAVAALAVSLVIEGGKLFFPASRPDPTNLLIALAGALVAFGVAQWLHRVLTGEGPVPRAQRSSWDRSWDQVTHPTSAAPAPAASTRSAERPSVAPVAASGASGGPRVLATRPIWPAPTPAGIALGVLAGLPLVAGILAFPLAWPILGVGLVLYGVLLWFLPLAWLAAIPALLPALDLSQISGRLPLDPFDLCVLTTLAAGYARTWGVRPAPWPNRLFPFALVLLWMSWAVSVSAGLWPLLGGGWPPPDGSHSPVDAWMVGKGMLWALLLVPLIRRVPSGHLGQAKELVAQGVLAGLAIVALAVLWERHVFVGLWDFENVFRVTGTFSNMHTGGAYIEAFLAFGFPFLAVIGVSACTWTGRAWGMLLAVLASYAMMVTFSRGGWAGLVAGLLVVLVGLLRRRVGARSWVAAAVLMAAVAGAALPVLTGGFARERLAQSLADLKTRVDHWSRALSMMAPGPGSVLVGEGFGQYPVTWLLRAGVQPPPGTYAILRDGDNPYLRLGGGEAVFLDQRVAIEPGQTYRLSGRVRQPAGAGVLSVPICEKALLYSFECQEAGLAPHDAGSDWQHLAAEIVSGQLGAGGRWPHPPVKLALHLAGPAAALDLDDLSLKNREGRELLANGNFSDGAKRWLFVTDQDLAWHIHEQWVEVYFAQGLLGVLALALLLAAAGRALWPGFRAGEPFAVGLSAALAGILAVGLLGSLMDTARLAMLVYLGALLPTGTFPGKERPRRWGHSGRRHRGAAPRRQTGARPPSDRGGTEAAL
jgi:glycopeptide antibiotics resistance protein